MAIDNQEIKALRRAVVDSPDDIELRLRLSARLLDADQPQGAWHQCIRVLNKDADHIEALRLAHRAAVEVGAVRRAEEYARKLAEVPSDEPHIPGEKRFNVKGVPLRLIRGGREDSGKYPAFRP